MQVSYFERSKASQGRFIKCAPPPPPPPPPPLPSQTLQCHYPKSKHPVLDVCVQDLRICNTVSKNDFYVLHKERAKKIHSMLSPWRAKGLISTRSRGRWRRRCPIWHQSSHTDRHNGRWQFLVRQRTLQPRRGQLPYYGGGQNLNCVDASARNIILLQLTPLKSTTWPPLRKLHFNHWHVWCSHKRSLLYVVLYRGTTTTGSAFGSEWETRVPSERVREQINARLFLDVVL